MAYGITAAGFVRKTEAEIKTSLENRFKALDAFGTVAALGAEDPLGIIVGIMKLEISELWELAENAYYSFSIDNATGADLDRIVAYKGLVRQGLTNSTVLLTFTGTNGVTLAVGEMIAQTPQGIKFINTEAGTILGGTMTISARATVAGTTGNVASASIIEIVTPKAGIDTVTNAAEASGGSLSETDAELRQRYKLASAFGGSSVAAIQAILNQVTGVTTATVGENITDSIDVNGLPPHSYNAIIDSVDSTNEQEVFNAFLNYAPAGIPSYGAKSITLPDTNGQDKTYYYDEPETTNIYVTATITANSGWDADYVDVVKKAIVQEIGGTWDGISYAGNGIAQNVYSWKIIGNIDANGVTGF